MSAQFQTPRNPHFYVKTARIAANNQIMHCADVQMANRAAPLNFHQPDFAPNGGQPPDYMSTNPAYPVSVHQKASQVVPVKRYAQPLKSVQSNGKLVPVRLDQAHANPQAQVRVARMARVAPVHRGEAGNAAAADATTTGRAETPKRPILLHQELRERRRFHQSVFRHAALPERQITVSNTLMTSSNNLLDHFDLSVIAIQSHF
ncbi:unnamed protein product [Caenorhabditis sp. 36 PRJEB53466]|nr:unnamed protein product [Caenorhabditis sp. 36 PRJEB53466]